ncbi:MAG: flippase-like domain-containing protein [Flavipsychrobacter sp.]|nr:flippase-like domain-containing protein [Flavipsychrobacter sp.]
MKALKVVLQYLVFLGLGIGIIYYMFNSMSAADKAAMYDSMKQTRLWIIFPVLVSGYLSHWFRALRWKMMLKPLDIVPTTTNTTLAILIGYLVNLLVPRMGEVAKCTILAKYEHVPADKMVGTVVAERAFDVLVLGLITLTAFGLQADVIGEFVNDKILSAFAAKTTLIAAGISGMVFFVLLLVYVARKYQHSKIGRFIKGLSDGVATIWKLENRGRFLLLTVLIWGNYYLQVMMGFWSLPATEHLGWLCGMVVLVFGSVGMIATPGGLGAYPALVALILGYYHMSPADGQALGWVSWVAQAVIVILLGVGALIVLPIFNRKKHHAAHRVDTK